jgi:hypothetical protein
MNPPVRQIVYVDFAAKLVTFRVFEAADRRTSPRPNPPASTSAVAVRVA